MALVPIIFWNYDDMFKPEKNHSIPFPLAHKVHDNQKDDQENCNRNDDVIFQVTACWVYKFAVQKRNIDFWITCYLIAWFEEEIWSVKANKKKLIKFCWEYSG